MRFLICYLLFVSHGAVAQQVRRLSFGGEFSPGVCDGLVLLSEWGYWHTVSAVANYRLTPNTLIAGGVGLSWYRHGEYDGNLSGGHGYLHQKINYAGPSLGIQTSLFPSKKEKTSVAMFETGCGVWYMLYAYKTVKYDNIYSGPAETSRVNTGALPSTIIRPYVGLVLGINRPKSYWYAPLRISVGVPNPRDGDAGALHTVFQAGLGYLPKRIKRMKTEGNTP